MSLRKRVEELESMCVKRTRKFDPLGAAHDSMFYQEITHYIDRDVKKLQKQVKMLTEYLKLEEHKPDCTTVLRKKKNISPRYKSRSKTDKQ